MTRLRRLDVSLDADATGLNVRLPDSLEELGLTVRRSDHLWLARRAPGLRKLDIRYGLE